MFDVRELADIYGLPEETVKVQLLESLSSSLAAVFGTEIEVLSSEAGNLEIYSYRDLSGDLQVRSIPLSSIGSDKKDPARPLPVTGQGAGPSRLRSQPGPRRPRCRGHNYEGGESRVIVHTPACEWPL